MPWRATVPDAIAPALEHLRQTFSDVHSACFSTTYIYSYAELHKERPADLQKEHFRYLQHLKARSSPQTVRELNQAVSRGNEAAIFKGFFDLYVGAALAEALKAFRHLTEIAFANEARLFAAPLSWAENQTSRLVRDEAIHIPNWVRDVCDIHLPDPEDDTEEQIYWRKWRAPEFLAMRPNGNQAWNPSSAWNRSDAATSESWLDHFQDQYVMRLELRIRQAVGETAVELAKVTRPLATDSTSTPKKTTSTSLQVSKHKSMTEFERQRQSVIFGAIQAGLVGLSYCRALDSRRLSIPGGWIAGGCPRTYADAYISGEPWQKKIQDEKYRFAKKYRDTPPAELERLVQHVQFTRGTRRTRR